jgi:acid phosphatase family membrane protein YuiD
MREGLGSSAFAITLVLASVVMYDAAGVRRAASIQARILNQMLEELFAGRPIAHERLRELLGHTPVEVLVGAVLGVSIGYLFTR